MRRKTFLIGGLVLLMLSFVLPISTPEKSTAANTVSWTEVDPPASSGTFVSEVCGDINEDGHLDIIGGSLLGIGVVAGNGDGTWTPLTPVAVSGVWYGLALGDVNNDGKLDLVAAENSTGIYIWTGDGAGGWTTMASPAGAGSFWSVALDDLDNDGNLDIAAGSGDGAGLQVWMGDGAGAWTSASTGLPIAGNCADIALGDVDRNGRPDMVAATQGGGVRAWRWDGASWTAQLAGLPLTGDYYGVALGDLDHDGDLDIVATGDGTGVGAWSGSVSGTWSWTDAATGLPDNGQYWEVGLSDVNNDGNLDVVAAVYSGGVQAWLSNGGGDWAEVSTGLPDTDAYYGLVLGDWNDDGMPDISAGHNAGVRAWVDDGTPDVLGGWQQIVSPTTSGIHYGADVGDFDHDGKLDVVAATDGDGLQLWTGNGGNAWSDIASWTTPDLPTTGTYHTPALADIDNDGYLDVIVSRGTGGGIQVWRFLNSGWYEAGAGLPTTGTYGDLDTGDFNDDGYVDFVAIGQGQGVKAWAGNGGTSWALTVAGLPTTPTFYSVALGDINRDGYPDIVAGSNGSGIGVWQASAMGTGWASQALPTSTGSWWGIALGDVNDDGDLDIVAAAYNGGVSVWAGDGAFGWTALTGPATSGDFWGLDLGDYNNDGALDVVAGTNDDKGILVWTGDGGSTWISYTTNLPVSGKYPAVRFGEIDNDGSLDLVGAKQGNGSVHAWTGAEGAPPSGWDNFSPTNWITSYVPLTLTVEVLDSGSGLNPNSALYSTWNGVVWSTWKPADCTGSPGVTTTQTMSAINVIFGQDSGPYPHTRNQIRFRVSDMAGNTGYSDDYTVRIDATPPNNPTDFPDSSHWPGGGWENDDTIWVDWDGASDATSSVAGYSYVFSTTYELPDTVRDTFSSEATSDPLDDGEWYIYVRTQDGAGNWTPDAVYEGPFRIDTGPPTNPTGHSSSHDEGVWSNDNTIHIDWWGAADDGSGVWGYGYSWTEVPLTPPDEILKGTETYTTSPPLDDGNSWYFHIRTVDHAGIWTSDTVHWGPFYIDTADPATCSITSPDESSSSSFLVTWACIDALSSVDCYDVQVRDGAGGSWTFWQTCTTDFSATYTGAQNAHTYYFRVRAHDHAGNVSGYLDTSQTVVLLPPGISGFTPSSGFASAGQDNPPLQLVPGTEVTVNGNGFTGGTVYFNDVAMEPTQSYVVDDTEIRAVIGVGTPTGSGSIRVSTPGGDAWSADDFEVVEQPFPVRWGSGFDNFSTPAGDMSWSIFEKAFGTCSVNFCPIPNPLIPWRFLPCRWCRHSWLVRRPEARIFYNSTRDVADEGDCYGFSYLTMDYMSGSLAPDDYVAEADVPASLMFTAPNLADAIRARQWRQKSLEAQLGLDAGERWFNHNDPLEFRDAIQGHLTRGERVMICLSDHDRPDGYHGHCVNPYAVDGNLIRIYDNNWSYIVNGDAAMERAIEVHADSWSYGAYGDSWPDDDNTMQILPYEIADGPNTIPSDVGRFIFGNSEAGHFSIRDSEGSIIGYDETGQYTRTLTSAHPVFPRMGISQTIEGYYLSEPGEYTLHINGTASGAYSATIFSAAGTGLVLEDVSMTPSTRDEVTFELPVSTALLSVPQPGATTTDGGNFVISTSDAGKAATIVLFRQGSGMSEQRTYTMEGIAFDSGAPLSVTTESDADALVVAGGSGSTYDLCFYSYADGQMPAEFCWSSITLLAGDRHILTPEDWSHLNTTRVQLETDAGNDGSIDETQWLVGHGLALSMQNEPTVIQSGDLLTYTLTYTVTGEEMAPNAVLSTSVPISTTFVSATGGVVPVGDALTWTLGDLTPPADGQVTFVVQVDPVPSNVVLGTIAYLRDNSGRWAMASSASAGPDFGSHAIYLPLVLRNYAP